VIIGQGIRQHLLIFQVRSICESHVDITETEYRVGAGSLFKEIGTVSRGLLKQENRKHYELRLLQCSTIKGCLKLRFSCPIPLVERSGKATFHGCSLRNWPLRPDLPTHYESFVRSDM
jgi:hypothetical protein